MNLNYSEPQIDPTKYCEMYLVRHGLTQSNKDRIIIGHGDSPLTIEGEEYLKQVAFNFRELHFDAIFASDLGRAITTAEILKGERDLEIQTRGLLRERFHGTLEDQHDDKYQELLKEQFPNLEKVSSTMKFTLKLVPDWESVEEAGHRYILALREIAAGYISKRVLVAGHGTALRGFLSIVTGKGPEAFPSGTLKNGGYVVILCDGVDFFIKEMDI